jgi:hypothetical protein
MFSWDSLSNFCLSSLRLLKIMYWWHLTWWRSQILHPLPPWAWSFLSYLWEFRVLGSVTYPSSWCLLFCYLNRVWHLWFGCSGLWLSYLCLQHIWEDKFILLHSFFLIGWDGVSFFFLMEWDLNSGLYTCKVGTLLLEPHLHLKMGFFSTLCLCWPWTTILPISNSQS